MRIRIFTDLRFTALRAPTGVSKHIHGMVRGLAADCSNRVSVLAARDQVDAQRQIPAANTLCGLPTTVLPLSWKPAEALWTVYGRPSADRWCNDVDWVYCPKNDFIPLRNVRVAVTIHGAAELDPAMRPRMAPAALLNRWRRRIAYRRMVDQATVVLTVSEFLKAQVVNWFGVEPERVCVVGNGVEPEYFRSADLPRGVSGEPNDSPYALAVGGLNYLDGGDRLVLLAKLMLRKLPHCRLLVAGCQHEERFSKQAMELPNLTLLGYQPSDRLALYMRDAVALVFPTRYETFGIAAAEAMASGTPVITCSSTAVPEVVGDAGLYVDPDQPESMVEALVELQTRSELRSDLIARGRQRSLAYSWSACVSRLQEVLEKY
jgi:glycosyltransferase involved in cell wall biosynthesis